MAKTPRAILQELRVHNGNAIADVVTVHTRAHCYEIKGDTDSVYRLLKQCQFYDLAFNKITLVTTDRQLNKALRLAPAYWGIVRCSRHGDQLSFSYVRRAKSNPLFDKKTALLTLWKSELVDVALPLSAQKIEKLNRSQLSELIATNLSSESLGKSIGEKLVSRSFKS